jgi:predicted ArsR family transcriptional regulator
MTPEDMFAKRWAELAKAEGHRPNHKYRAERDVQVSSDMLARVVTALVEPMSKAQIAAAIGATENHVRYAIRKLEKAGKVMRVAEPQPEKGRMIPDKWQLKGER